jgi:hypothetical protein
MAGGRQSRSHLRQSARTHSLTHSRTQSRQSALTRSLTHSRTQSTHALSASCRCAPSTECTSSAVHPLRSSSVISRRHKGQVTRPRALRECSKYATKQPPQNVCPQFVEMGNATASMQMAQSSRAARSCDERLCELPSATATARLGRLQERHKTPAIVTTTTTKTTSTSSSTPSKSGIPLRRMEVSLSAWGSKKTGRISSVPSVA